MNKENLQDRTKAFSIRIINMIDHMPDTQVSNVISNSLLRAATSIGTNYHGACRSTSAREFINRLKVAEEKTDEILYWLDLVEKSNIFQPEKIRDLRTETNELLSIFVSSIKTAKSNLKLNPGRKSRS